MVPRVASAEAAARLAYYSDGYDGVLAPRGWHCAAVSGSGGGALIVTPGLLDVRTIGQMTSKFSGPGVQLTWSLGGTSGRFAVARRIAQLFPRYRKFAWRVAHEDGIVFDPLPSGPDPGDRIRRLSATEVEFTTPAGGTGLGREASMLDASLPIHGRVLLYPSDDMNVMQLSYRLPRGQAGLAPAIVREARRHGGRASAPSR
jgi:hypothetical protein